MISIMIESLVFGKNNGLEISGLALIDLNPNTAHLKRTRSSKDISDDKEIEVTSIRKNIYIHKKCSQYHHMITYKTCDFFENTENKIYFSLMQLNAHIVVDVFMLNKNLSMVLLI
jgi:hypothetical protein